MTTNRLVSRRMGVALLCCVLLSACGTNAPVAGQFAATGAGKPGAVGTRGGLVKVRRAEAPFRLTSAEGTELRLTRLEVKGVIDGMLAFTELHLTFQNAEPRVIEGRFRVALPETASISRFAMETADGWQEGEMVEKSRARTVYEDFLHRRQDPALLEKALGNEFSARIFPIAENAEKHLILSYSEELTGEEPYVVALSGIPAIGRLEVRVNVLGASERVLTFERNAYVPTEDLVVDTSKDELNVALRNGELCVMRVAPKWDEPPVALGNTMVLLDTSASRALGFDRQLRLVKELADVVGNQANAELTLAAFDQSAELVYRGAGARMPEDVVRRLKERGAMGATDIESALVWAKAEARQHPVRRLILVTDGVPTVHDVGSDPLRPMVAAMSEVGIQRVDVVLSGGTRDTEGARAWTRLLPEPGVVVDADAPLPSIRRWLTHRAQGRLRVNVPEATWFWPEELDGLAEGEGALIYAEVPPGKRVGVQIGALAYPVEQARQSDRALLQRAFARARISSLVERQKEERDNVKLSQQIVELSQRFRVISPYTALLVLETEDDYQRFSVKRDGEILRIADGKVVATPAGKTRLSRAPGTGEPRELLERRRVALPSAGSAGAEARSDTARARRDRRSVAGADEVSARGNMWGDSLGDAVGSGGLGLSGVGEGMGMVMDTEAGGFGVSGAKEGIGSGAIGADGRGVETVRGAGDSKSSSGGFGSGHGRLGGSHRTRAPRVRMGATEVSGRLPPEVIQRIVRQHYGRLRMCYEIGLAKNPSLSGRVSVGFTIDRQGGVVRAKDDGSTLRDQGVVSCVKTVFSGLTFPPPEGGMVVVRYPIYFDNGDAGGNTRTRQPVAAVPEAPRPAPEPIFDDEPWDGRFGDVMAELSAGRVELAVARAEHWKKEHPEDFLAWVALGRAYRARGELERAARALGSIVDLWGFRADLRRFVGGELEAIHPTEYLPLAVDSYRHALDDRPDHPSSTLWLAVALMKQGKYAEALKLLEVAHNTRYPDRYRGIHRIFGDVLGICAAAYAKQHPEDDGITRKRLEAMGLWLEDTPTTKLLLTWETDANDVDFHVYDQKGTLAYYAQPVLPAPGGELYADVTEGYGPECFSVPGAPQLGDRRYSLLAHYYRRGPMGAGLGKLEILEHDGHGGVAFESRPYVVTRDGARVSLGDVRFPGTSKAK